MVDLPQGMAVVKENFRGQDKVHSAKDRLAIGSESTIVNDFKTQAEIYQELVTVMEKFPEQVVQAYEQMEAAWEDYQLSCRNVLKAAIENAPTKNEVKFTAEQLDHIKNNYIEVPLEKMPSKLVQHFCSDIAKYSMYERRESREQWLKNAFMRAPAPEYINLVHRLGGDDEEIYQLSRQFNKPYGEAVGKVHDYFSPYEHPQENGSINYRAEGHQFRSNIHDLRRELDKNIRVAIESATLNGQEFTKDSLMEVIQDYSLDLKDGTLKDRVNLNGDYSKKAQAIKDAIQDKIIVVAPEKSLESEKQYKRLFFNKLSQIAAREGIELDAASLVEPENYQFEANLGSQSILLRNNFERQGGQNLPGALAIGESESSTKYQFTFGFFEPQPSDFQNPENLDAKAVPTTYPLFLVDDAALRKLEEAGVSKQEIQSFFEGFMQMGGMAEHDYWHAITLPHLTKSKMEYYSVERDNDDVGELERHALATHARVVQELFTEHPQRKEAVLEWAARDFTKIEEFQNKLLEKADNPQAIQETKEVVTYLSEIYSHRLFRVISPVEPDLEKPLSSGRSVKEIINTLQLLPAGDPPIPIELGGYDMLVRNGDYVMNPTNPDPQSPYYSRIHADTAAQMRSTGELNPLEFSQRLQQVIADIKQKAPDADQEHLVREAYTKLGVEYTPVTIELGPMLKQVKDIASDESPAQKLNQEQNGALSVLSHRLNQVKEELISHGISIPENDTALLKKTSWEAEVVTRHPEQEGLQARLDRDLGLVKNCLQEYTTHPELNQDKVNLAVTALNRVMQQRSNRFL